MNKLIQFVAISLGLLVFLSGCNTLRGEADKSDFYIPTNYVGPIVIIYDCKDGITPSKINERKQIIVPQNGIYKLKEKVKFGQISYKYFMISGSNEKAELKTYQSFESNISDNYYVDPGTTVNASIFDSSNKEKFTQYGFVVYVHKKGEIFPENYSDTWISDSLIKQININTR